MTDYISREAAIKEVVVNSVKHRADPDVATETIHGIEKLPAADVQPVVMCKDCVHYIFSDMVCDYHYLHQYHAEPNEYCSHAARR